MQLADVRTEEQLKAYYDEHGLHTLDEKIQALKDEMGVLAIQGTSVDKEVDLAVLEETAMMGVWPAYRNLRKCTQESHV